MKKFQKTVSILLAAVFVFMNLTPVSSIAQDVIPESADYTYEVSAADYANDDAAEAAAADTAAVEVSAAAAPAQVSIEPSVPAQSEPAPETQPQAAQSIITESSEAAPTDPVEAVHSGEANESTDPDAESSETSEQPASATETGAAADNTVNSSTDATYQEQEKDAPAAQPGDTSEPQTGSVISDPTEPGNTDDQDSSETPTKTEIPSETPSETPSQEESQTESSVQETESETQIQYPAVTLTKKVTQDHNEIEVTAQLPEGAVPEGTTMQLAAIDISQGLINQVAKETKKDVEKLWAVYIGFFDKDGTRVYPAQPVYLTIEVPGMGSYDDGMKSVIAFNNEAKPAQITYTDFNRLKIEYRTAQFYTTDFYNYSSFVFAALKEPQTTTQETTTEEATTVQTQEAVAEVTEPSGEDTTEKSTEEETTEEETTTAQETTTEEETTTEAPRTKTVYTYDDAYVQVTAVLADPEAVPDDAELVVKPVYKESLEYNYDAYMKALNDANADEYTEDNTILYDISFMVQDKDEEGKPLETFSEYEPEAGSVQVSIRFKQRQLSKDIEAKKQQDVEVIHLSADKAIDTAVINDQQISAQNVNANVSIGGSETVNFNTDSFSVYAFSHMAEEEATVTVDLSRYLKDGREKYPYVSRHDENTDYISFKDLLAYVQLGFAETDKRVTTELDDAFGGNLSYLFTPAFAKHAEFDAKGLKIVNRAIVMTRDMTEGSVELKYKNAKLNINIKLKGSAEYDQTRNLFVVNADAVSVGTLVDESAEAVANAAKALGFDTENTEPVKTSVKDIHGNENNIYTATGAVGFDIDITDFVSEEGDRFEVPVDLAKMGQQINMIDPAFKNVKNINAVASLYHMVEGEAVKVENVEWQFSGDGKAITAFTFETTGFSPYMVAYTVDFTYTDEDGKTYAFSLNGGKSMMLSELADELNIAADAGYQSGVEFAADAADVAFSNPELLRVTRVEQDWLLESLQPFTSTEQLTITMNDGKVVVVQVTDEQEGYTLPLYGYNFGGLYGRSGLANSIIIGYPSDLGDALTFESISQLNGLSFTYASNGFDVESIGLVETERNTYVNKKYQVIGFALADTSALNAMTPDEYKNAYVSEDLASAQAKCSVLYGSVPGEAVIASLESGSALAVVWQEKPLITNKFGYIYISASPSKLALGNEKAITLSGRFTNAVVGDFTDDPIEVTVTLPAGLSFSDGSELTLAARNGNMEFASGTATISADRKSATFEVTKLNANGTQYFDMAATLDVTSEKTSETIKITANNGRYDRSGTVSITIDRPTVKVYFNGTASTTYNIYDNSTGLEFDLYVGHNNSTAGAVNQTITLQLPSGIVNVVSAEARTTGTYKNTIDNVQVNSEANTITYQVTNFNRSSAWDIIHVTVKTPELAEGQITTSGKIEVSGVETDTQSPVLGTNNITLTVKKPTIRIGLGSYSNYTYEAFAGKKDVTFTLYVHPENSVANAAADEYVVINFPDTVTIKGVERANNRCTIDSLVFESNKISYHISKYSSTSTSGASYYDQFSVTVDVRELKEGETAPYEQPVTVDGTHIGENTPVVLSTRQPVIRVTEPYFSIQLMNYMRQWYLGNAQNGQGGVTGRSEFDYYKKTLKFTGDDTPAALAMHGGMSFENQENPLSSLYMYDSGYNRTMVGQAVKNPNTGYTWTCVGFVPYDGSYGNDGWLSIYADNWNGFAGKYYFPEEGGYSLAGAQAYIQSVGGILYGTTPDEEAQAAMLATWDARNDKNHQMVAVWFIAGPKSVRFNYNQSYYEGWTPVDWDVTTPRIQVSVEVPNGETDHVVFTYTIPEDMDKEELNLSTFGVKVPNIIQLPGDSIDYTINVIDESGKYVYKPESGAIGTIPWGISQSVGHGFENYTLGSTADDPYFSNTPRRYNNSALQELSRKSGIRFDRPTDEIVGEALYELGYGAIPVSNGSASINQPLALYKLASSENIGSLSKQPIALFKLADGEETSGLTKKPMTEFMTASGEPDYAKITRYLLDDYYLDYFNGQYMGENSDADSTAPYFTCMQDLGHEQYVNLYRGDNSKSVLETNSVIANALYYAWYEYMWPIIAADGSKIGIPTYMLNPTANGGNGFNGVIFDQWQSTEQKDDNNNIIYHTIKWTQLMDGEGASDAVQAFRFANAVQFKLVQSTKTIRAYKVWEGDKSEEGAEESYDLSDLRQDVRFVLEGSYTDDDNNINFINLPEITRQSAEKIVEATKDDKNPKYAEWTNLPAKYDGHEITYIVKEISGPDAYKASYTTVDEEGNSTTGFTENVSEQKLTKISEKEYELTIKNTLKRGNLKISKSLFVNDEDKSSEYADKSFKVKVFTTVGEDVYWVVNENGLLSKNESGIFEVHPGTDITIKNLPVGEYTATEQIESSETGTAEQQTLDQESVNSEEELQSDDSTNAAGTNNNNAQNSELTTLLGDMTFVEALSRTEDTVNVTEDTENVATASLVNKYTSGKYCIAVTKQWQANGEAYIDDSLRIAVRLERRITPAEQAEVSENDSISAENSVTSGWEPVNIPSGDGTQNEYVILNKDNNWSYVAVGMEQMDEDGNRYSYRWIEGTINTDGSFNDGSPTGWKFDEENTEVIQSTEKNGTQLIFLTKLVNKRIDIDIPVTKVWDDNDNILKLRPESITVYLDKSVKEGDKTVLEEGYQEMTLTQSDADPDRSDIWKGTFENLPKYENENEISYSIREEKVPDYTTSITSPDQENLDRGFTVTNTCEKSGQITLQKIWADDKNKENLRPESLTVKLLKNGEEIGSYELPTGNTQVPEDTETEQYAYDADSDQWTITVLDLPKLDEQNVPIKYTWQEEMPDGYELLSENTVGTVTTFINALNTDTTSLTVQKRWVDGNNVAGKRPDSIEVKLTGTIVDEEDKEVIVKEETVTLNDENLWTTTIEKLPKFKDDKPITYTWTEDETNIPAEYELKTEVSGTVTVLTNTNTDIPTTTLHAVKIWEDGSGGSAALTLIGWVRDEENDGVLLEIYRETQTSGYNWAGRPLFTEEYEPIFYTLIEEGVDDMGHIGNYTSSVIGDESGWIVTNHPEYVPPVEPVTYPTPTPPTQPVEPPTPPTPPTEPPTEPVTQPITEPVTEPVTQPPVEPEVPYTPPVAPPVTIVQQVPATPYVPEPAEPAAPRNNVVTIDDYLTPLGIDVMINHAGDCFD